MSERLMVAARTRRRVLLAGLVGICLSASSPASAQTALFGLVFDPNGGMAAHVPLNLRHVSTGTTRTTVSSAIGVYDFGVLPPGNYIIAANVDPFAPVEMRVTLVLGSRSGVDIRLKFRREEQIDVRLPTTSDGQLASFSSDLIDTLFLPNGRTLQSLLTQVPGIVVTDSVGTLAQYTAVGQRRFANRLTIDGISADLAADTAGFSVGEAASGALPAVATSGGTQTLVPLDAIGEVDIRTVNADTAHAQTPGAQTSIVTRAGTNRFNASAFAATRPDRWAARDWFSNAGLKPRRQVRYDNMGASAGGPLVPRRLFYLFAWERQDVDRPATTTVEVPSLSLRESVPEVVRPLLDAYPSPNGPEVGQGLAQFTHRFPTRSHFSVVSLRSDVRSTDNVRAFVRLNWGHSNGDAVTAARLQTPFPAYTRAERALTRTATAGLSAYGSGWAHEARFNVSVHRGGVIAHEAAYGDAAPIPFALLTPASSSETDTGFNIFLFPGPAGVILSGPLARTTQTQAQVTDTWSLVKGRHTWTMGLDFRQTWNSIDPPRDFYTYRFRNAMDILAARPAQVNIVHGAAARVSTRRSSAFVEDTVRLTPRTSLALGLRFSAQPAPVDRTGLEPVTFGFEALPEIEQRKPGQPLWPTQVNLAPRLALTYQLGRAAGRETTIRTGWGVVFDEMTSPGVRAFGNGYPYVVTRIAGLLPFPIPDDVLASRDIFPALFEPGTLGHYYAFARDLRSPRTYAWHAGADQALGRGQQLSLTYAGSLGRDLIYRHEYFYGGQLHRIHAYTNAATSDYHALLVNYTHRLSRALEGRVAYTWSHAIDTDSGETLADSPPPYLIPLSSNRGSADYDRRHVLHGWMSYRVPTLPVPDVLEPFCRDWRIEGTILAQSGVPVSAMVHPNTVDWPYDVRADVVAGVPIWLVDPDSPGGRRLNRAAFAIPEGSRQGTLGRNGIRGFPLRQVNLAVSRKLLIGKRGGIDVRLEVFNVFNTPSFGPPPGFLTDQPFGRSTQSYAETLGTGSLSVGGLIPLQQAGGPRAIQVGVRLGL